MRLRIVGSAGSLPGPDNAASCYLVEADHEGRTWRLVLDMGSGAMGPLQRWCDPVRVDGVLISHGHPDHCADLAAMTVLRRYGPAMGEDLPLIPLIGPPGVDARIADVSGDPDDRGQTTFDYLPTEPGASHSIGPFTVTAARAWHPVPALAYLIEAGSSALLFTGDTDRCAEVDALAARSTAVLGEAGWAHREINPPGIHMNGDQLGEMVAAAGKPRLIVTHIASWVEPEATMEQVREHVPGAELARPGDLFTL